ncbi:MAG: hypothetical protein Q9174_001386 [Haloplaca sp. 1 TL-2023]
MAYLMHETISDGGLLVCARLQKASGTGDGERTERRSRQPPSPHVKDRGDQLLEVLTASSKKTSYILSLPGPLDQCDAKNIEMGSLAALRSSWMSDRVIYFWTSFDRTEQACGPFGDGCGDGTCLRSSPCSDRMTPLSACAAGAIDLSFWEDVRKARDICLPRICAK